MSIALLQTDSNFVGEGAAGISDSGEECSPPCGQARAACAAAAAAQAGAVPALAVRPAAEMAL